MKKTINLVFVLVAFIVICGVESASAQQRIKFDKGKSSTTISSRTGFTVVEYAIKASGGQKITVTVQPKSGVGISIRFGDNELLRKQRGGTYTVYTEEGGDYYITLGSTDQKDKGFTLKISISKMKGDI